MSNADIKCLSRILHTLNQARHANPRLDIQPPPPEEIEGARAALRRLDALQLYEALVDHPELVGNYLAP